MKEHVCSVKPQDDTKQVTVAAHNKKGELYIYYIYTLCQLRETTKYMIKGLHPYSQSFLHKI